ncbi:hypothetical protein [Alicyclobacillus suci]|uniref:hypothetical protein n=1 Tax=Alicyclobacillus suci TaxID=2816080 RepID=UPI001A900EE9|nr:hypothetical protein [Alicyclobacillus suci]
MTSSNFIDLLVAVFAMILMLISHKLIKSFLDHIFPGGHGHGPGALLSGMMEGLGMAAGRKLFDGGISLAKTGASLTSAAGIAGVASALSHMRNKKAFGEDGLLSGVTKATSAVSASEPNGLYPGSLPTEENETTTFFPPTGFTMSDTEPSGFETGKSNSSMSFGAPLGESDAGFSATQRPGAASQSVYDSQSTLYGAKTQLRPSAQSRMEELSGLRNAGVGEAFLNGAKGRLKSDAMHLLSGERGKFSGGVNSIFAVARQEFGKNGDNKMVRDSYLPSIELLNAARNGDQFAMSDMAQIGKYQNDMDQGLQWYEQGLALANAIQPDYDSAQAELDNASQELDGISVIKHQFESSGDTSSPMYQSISTQYEHAIQRKETASAIFSSRAQQMKSANDMIERGEKRMLNAQNNISKINMGWYSPNQQSSGRILQAAQARAKRITLSDLGQSPAGHR